MLGAVIGADVFRDQPTLTGERVRLEPLTPAVRDDYLATLRDPEVRRLTGSHDEVHPVEVEMWLASRQDHHDRADWAAVRIADNAFLGEAVINLLDVDNASANYRILLGSPHMNRGYGTEITRLVVDYALSVGLHRLSLGVFDFNPRARRVYEKCGFVLEGRLRDTLHWDGEWHDELIMSVLAGDPR
ncbi:RimJ/RimL family protein N-acetyltransferase [Pseudonocardia hierapolitana]|uniref:RimJ/RimL family protein N-acetyltransferase n=1 Tax=Pseudonocardia hierapolitana TaxID=1128676 RepID=A0A561SXX6_9PSEU|nr:RimJ/RimL family protein N-acetyltransferase [Pseudonocardia hierapolitana]